MKHLPIRIAFYARQTNRIYIAILYLKPCFSDTCTPVGGIVGDNIRRGKYQ